MPTGKNFDLHQKCPNAANQRYENNKNTGEMATSS